MSDQSAPDSRNASPPSSRHIASLALSKDKEQRIIAHRGELLVTVSALKRLFEDSTSRHSCEPSASTRG